MNRKYSIVFISLFIIAAVAPIAALAQQAEPRVCALAGPPWLVVDDTTYDWEDSDPETPWGIERIYAVSASDATLTEFDQQIIVAVVDTGIDLDHPDLAPNIAWSYDEINDIDGGGDDDNGHGTHCAGTIAAIKDGNGVVGVNPYIKLYAIKVLDRTGSGSFTDVADGVIRAAEGPDGVIGTADDADVISMSLGGTYDSPELHAAIQYAYSYGVVVVAAAGNEGDGDSTTDEISYPAAYDEVIAVGATDKDDTIASFSNSGPFVEVTAPGVNIYSTYKNGAYDTLSGTSMACPHVAGVVALILAMSIQKYGYKLSVGTFTDTGTDTVRGILHNCVLDLSTAGWDPAFGYGLVMADTAVSLV
ncbi:MAG: S8 family peptidase [Candidatus Heimdallarchaeaceae archaeon]